MKKLSLLLLIYMFVTSLHAQTLLNVEGDAKIRGRLDITKAENIFIGERTGNLHTSGTFNIAIGKSASHAMTTGNSNVFIGPFAGFRNTEGSQNIFIGRSSGLDNTVGKNNTFIGYDSGLRNTTAIDNTFVGRAAGQNNTTGNENTFIGRTAGQSNTTGPENTFIGKDAGRRNTSAEDNTFVGQDAGEANTTGDNNTFLGQGAGFLNTTGSQNTFIGELAGQGNTIGSNNTLVGQNASFTSNNTENAFIIGANSIVTKSNSGIIGNIGTQEVRAYVNLSTASDKRMKKSIREDIKGLDFILQLRPVSYQMDLQKADKLLRKNNPATARQRDTEWAKELNQEQTAGQIAYQKALAEKSKIRYTGFIAQEVEKAVEKSRFAFSGLIKPTHDNDHYSLRYAEFVVPLVKGMQEQQTIINQQNRTIKDMQREIGELKLLVQQLLPGDPDGNNDLNIYLKQTPFLGQNTPNPFRQNTQVNYTIPKGINNAMVQISTADGKVLDRLTIQKQGEGYLNIDAHQYPAGTYFYSLILDGQIVETKQMLLAY